MYALGVEVAFFSEFFRFSSRNLQSLSYLKFYDDGGGHKGLLDFSKLNACQFPRKMNYDLI